MRLQRPVRPSKRVQHLTVRIISGGLPAGATADVTDVQLQGGGQSTGEVPNWGDILTGVGGRQWRNGVVHDGMEVVALANIDRATPTRVEVHADDDVRIGTYRFGRVDGTAHVDGRTLDASQGWGSPPVITQRSDLTVRTYTTGRAHLRLEWRDREP